MLNGQVVGCDKYFYKLCWFDVLVDWLEEELVVYLKLVLCGDYNIVFDDCDVYDLKVWVGVILCFELECVVFQCLCSFGLEDSFCFFDQVEKIFFWWDYWMLGFQKNFGLCIDYILFFKVLVEKCMVVGIDCVLCKCEWFFDYVFVWVIFS